MNNKFQSSSLYTIRPNNEENETNNTSNEQDDQGQGDQGEHEQQYGKEMIATYLFNIHTSVNQSNPCCYNLNLNIVQHYM
jgi:hypothetical protein